MKRLINILILVFGISFVILAIGNIIRFECIFKYLFDISCPGCGLTRSFRAIIDLNFYKAFSYNILGIPLFIAGVIICTSLIVDIVKNCNRTIQIVYNILKKYYIVIIILLVITTIINNINGI